MTGNIITEYLLTLNSMQDDTYQNVLVTFIRKIEGQCQRKVYCISSTEQPDFRNNQALKKSPSIGASFIHNFGYSP